MTTLRPMHAPGSTTAPAPSQLPEPMRTAAFSGSCRADRDVRVGVAVVLVGDVDVRAGEHVVPDHQRVMRDDVAAPADHAAVPDPQHRHRAEVLAGHHPGRQGDERRRSGCPRRSRSSARRTPTPAGRPPSSRGRTRRTSARPGYPRSPRRPAAPPPRPSAPPASAARGARTRGSSASRGRVEAGARVGAEAEAASWPQAPSISRPRVSRTVTGTPWASRRRTNSRCVGGPRRGPLRAGRRVERDQVDVREPPGQQRTQQVGPPGLVVDVLDQGVLDRDAAAGGRGVVPARRPAPRRPSSAGSPAPACRAARRPGRAATRPAVTERPSAASRVIAGTRPTVETVTERWEMPMPSGTGSVSRRTAASTLA